MIVRDFTSLPSMPTEEVKCGEVLFGNDFSQPALEKWFKQEEEAYYEGDAGNGDVDPWYAYMRYVNEQLGFKLLETLNANLSDILAIGPGSGIELEDLHSNNPTAKLHFVEASQNFQKQLAIKFPNSSIISPSCSGDIGMVNASVDLVTAFSVLHHIPNVSKVISEASRVLRNGGYFLVREPCSSMGDWGKPRSATPNERGISKSLLIKFALQNGFEIVDEPIPILFEPLNRIIKKTIGFDRVQHKYLYLVDKIVSLLVSKNDYYWRDQAFKKFGPSSYFYVFKKVSAN